MTTTSLLESSTLESVAEAMTMVLVELVLPDIPALTTVLVELVLPDVPALTMVPVELVLPDVPALTMVLVELVLPDVRTYACPNVSSGSSNTYGSIGGGVAMKDESWEEGAAMTNKV